MTRPTRRMALLAALTIASGLTSVLLGAMPAMADTFSNTAPITLPDPNCTRIRIRRSLICPGSPSAG